MYFILKSKRGSRGTAKSTKECEVIMVLPYKSKIHSPPYSCAIVLDPPKKVGRD